jgi:hypothetical protein
MATSPQLDDNLIQHIVTNIHNGNLTDAINIIMNDGDVNVDSVKTMMLVVEELTLCQWKTVTQVTQLMLGLIERWETL